MKEIKAIIKPFKANEILNQLILAGYPNLTVTLAEGTGNFQSEESTLSGEIPPDTGYGMPLFLLLLIGSMFLTGGLTVASRY